MVDKTSTLERLIPEAIESHDTTGRETLLLHYERYEFAAKQLSTAQNVLDIACGVGYGTRLMADNAPPDCRFTGVDISAESVDYAREHYATENIEYLVADALRYSRAGCYDAIVSLETIEHLPDPEAFIESALKNLKSGGLFIGSVPVTPSVDVNPHHLHDFDVKSFTDMLTGYCLVPVNELSQVQNFNPLKILGRKEKRLSDLRENLLGYYLSHPGAALRRGYATLRHGFNNKYLTLVTRKET